MLIWGGFFTSLWLAGFCLVLWLNFDKAIELGLNEWGDFLAGGFAPLAFFWLVLGYFQQGRELRISSKALQLQAEELKNSVQQQQELVRVTHEELCFIKKESENRRGREKRQHRPLFALRQGESFKDKDGLLLFKFYVENLGAEISGVSISVSVEDCYEVDISGLQRNRKWGKNKIEGIVFKVMPEEFDFIERLVCKINYYDGLGDSEELELIFEHDQSGDMSLSVAHGQFDHI